MKNFHGVIIEESLKSKAILQKVKIIKTDVEKVTQEHQTSWIKQWTLHTIEILENQAENIATEISQTLDSQHNWYADFKNDLYHYIIFCNKIFKIDRSKPEKYHDVVNYGVSLGIPDYQLPFPPQIK